MKGKAKEIVELKRKYRGFDSAGYVQEKINLINIFFEKNGLDSAVIGISGGIDSAVAFSLLQLASKTEGSPIKKVRGLVMPIFGKGTTDQDDAAVIAIEFLRHKDAEFITLPLTKPYGEYAQLNEEELGDKRPWALGQLASIVRTPMLYFQAAILQTQGFKSIVVGTTNRDEGAYIGFFGKASDAMVDLQPIADIHKSEVIEVAKILDVTDEIIEATPKGDVWDGRVDEEMIGAPYHFLEDYLLLRESFMGTKDENLINKWMLSSRNNFTDQEWEWYQNIEELHRINKHKYEVGNPAHFIDVLTRKIPGGWN